MELSQIIQTIIVVFLFGGILLYFVLLCIFKKKANITIVKKRVNTHRMEYLAEERSLSFKKMNKIKIRKKQEIE